MKQGAARASIRRLCPNLDREDGLETVLEVPIPEEMFTSMGTNVALRWQNMLTWMKAQTADKLSSPLFAKRLNELRFLLYLVGSPLIPLQVQLGHSVHRPVRDSSIVRLSFLSYNILFLKQNQTPVIKNTRTHNFHRSRSNKVTWLVSTVGSIDGEIHSATIYSSDGRAAGVERVAEHVRDGADKDKRIGVSPNER